ncbi:cell wall hydrolase [Sphingomonas sp.]|uniref:cell wall hydrolase n=1 Tax=Sphingomonas sp. TaxID=28214 RepID=UPI0025D18DF6|nr:cell wall hydrolase [Sphingomonas sp.]
MLAAAIVSLVGAGFSAQALGPQAKRVAAPAPVPQGYEAEEHFPGSAYDDVIDDAEAPSSASGTTGTAELPDLPVPADAVIDASIQPARPFALAGTATDRARALQCLTDAIYYEAAREPDDGQRAVAQVVLNRVRHPAFPHTVCGVVFQGSERRGCQFSFACDGAMARAPERQYWDRAARVAAAALDGGVFAAVGTATHYHTYAVTPSWNRALVMTGAFGAHFFHRWKGYWGTLAAFSSAYRGGEPLPGPHPSADPAPVAAPAAVVARTRPATTTRDTIQPAYADSGDPLPGYAPAPATARAQAPVTDDSQILDRWKDSGKPIR